MLAACELSLAGVLEAPWCSARARLCIRCSLGCLLSCCALSSLCVLVSRLRAQSCRLISSRRSVVHRLAALLLFAALRVPFSCRRRCVLVFTAFGLHVVPPAESDSQLSRTIDAFAQAADADVATGQQALQAQLRDILLSSGKVVQILAASAFAPALVVLRRDLSAPLERVSRRLCRTSCKP